MPPQQQVGNVAFLKMYHFWITLKKLGQNNQCKQAKTPSIQLD